MSRADAKTLLFGFALGTVNFFTVVIPVQWAVTRIVPKRIVEMFDQSHIFERQTTVELILIAGAVTLAAPFCEEYFFRGTLQRGLSLPSGPRWAGAVITAVVFSAFHFDPVGFPARLELGLLFGLLYQRTGSIWPGVMAHSVNATVTLEGPEAPASDFL